MSRKFLYVLTGDPDLAICITYTRCSFENTKRQLSPQCSVHRVTGHLSIQCIEWLVTSVFSASSDWSPHYSVHRVTGHLTIQCIEWLVTSLFSASSDWSPHYSVHRVTGHLTIQWIEQKKWKKIVIQMKCICYYIVNIVTYS